ncbi:MAG TPA: hypothetical protein VGQ91_17005, partial [Ideonella sp.]|nr:hypothetical protein [Ideonella sp.]
KVAAKTAGDAAKAAAANPAAAIDPTQWWTALSQQFTQLATSAMKDTATDAAKNLAGAMVKQSFDAAGETLKRAVEIGAQVPVKATKVAAKAAEGAVKAAAGAARGSATKRPPARKRG